MVNELPAQTDPLLTLITGTGFTVMLATADAVEVHPAGLVPVIE